MTKNAVALTALMLVACFASSAVSYCPQSHLSVNNNNMKSTDTIASGSRRFGSVLRMQGGGAAAKDVKIGFLGMGIMGSMHLTVPLICLAMSGVDISHAATRRAYGHQPSESWVCCHSVEPR